ncbi:Cu(I)-responsive transcriptional regulator [Pseudohongiella sp.]|uniref:HTH merR-type domain-containing protein n=1 Tax=marine sediment metagenome TaxID=412755 RepID=A0A0F9W9H1_9ZZZZ|nr:Cu(I)-responsive transcriptional regulator [Pseudohongiella sp.]HDZ08588.1 Cu(I)-responsive transcriptional regulator [Pseudohongiella sp.]HEA64082.1 Cu(I)-responsive transcriptional regulator [Pseudohongiella sp.]
MNISDAARRSGLSNKMVRHYESVGLIQPPPRSAAGYRQYSQRNIDELTFIAHARTLGFSIAQIGDLLSLRHDPHRASREVKAVAQQHLQELNAKMQELKRMQTLLSDMIAKCPGDDDPNCSILQQLDASDGESHNTEYRS